jgi:hypothetical protein
MPTNSLSAAQAWREANAKPRAKRGQAGTPPPVPKEMDVRKSVQFPREKPTVAPPPPSEAENPQAPTLDPDAAHDEPSEPDNTPRHSLRRARIAEKVGYNELVQTKRDRGSIEDIRKANQVYISSRNNRHKAEKDFKEWQRDEGVLLFFDEARDISSRPHIALKQMLEGGAKTLAPRLLGMPQKSIEKTLADYFDKMADVARQAI